MAGYLVTGGCGYLGSRLVGYLEKNGHYVRVLDNLSQGVPLSRSDCIELNIGDVTDLATVEHYMQGVDGCFHLADLSEYPRTGFPQTDINASLTGAFNVFSAAAKNCTKVVYVSSSSVYGDNADLPLNEASEPCPLTAYAADKRALELHAKVASITNHIPTVGLRLFNVYGECYPHERSRHDVVTNFLRLALDDKAISVFGGGQQTRDFVYVEDALRFMTAAMDYDAHVPEIFNICSGSGCSIIDLAERIIRFTQKSIPVIHDTSRPGDIFGSVGCPKKAFEKLGVATTVSLNEGLRRLVDFYAESNAKSALPSPDLSMVSTNKNYMLKSCDSPKDKVIRMSGEL